VLLIKKHQTVTKSSFFKLLDLTAQLDCGLQKPGKLLTDSFNIIERRTTEN